MANHIHWFFVPHYDDTDVYFSHLKNSYVPPATSPLFAKVKLIIHGGGGTAASFSGIDPNDDQVYVYGHSNGVELGSKKVKYQSVKLMNLLSENGLPSTQKVIKLFGCNTATLVPGYDKSLAEQFQELAHSTKKFPGAVVYGYTGFVTLKQTEGHKTVYTGLQYNGEHMEPTSDPLRAKDRRLAFPQTTTVHQATRYELEKGKGWQMVHEVTSST